MQITKQSASMGAFVFGFGFDLLLNILVRTHGFWDVGLLEYFNIHNTLEAMCIAGGLMLICMWAILTLWGGDPNRDGTTEFIFVAGMMIDVIFRLFHIMPSLDEMYTKLSPITSMLWAGGPLAASFLVTKYYISVQ
jgi:hypothetical protein